MPLDLDDIDIALLNSLMKDGHKSFRELSREIKVSAPTVKTRYERLVHAGLITGVTVDLDLQKLGGGTTPVLPEDVQQKMARPNKVKLGKNIFVKMVCEYCKDSIDGKPHILKFANTQRFFCCTSCKSLYREKYKNKMTSMTD